MWGEQSLKSVLSESVIFSCMTSPLVALSVPRTFHVCAHPFPLWPSRQVGMPFPFFLKVWRSFCLFFSLPKPLRALQAVSSAGPSLWVRQGFLLGLGGQMSFSQMSRSQLRLRPPTPLMPSGRTPRTWAQQGTPHFHTSSLDLYLEWK